MEYLGLGYVGVGLGLGLGFSSLAGAYLLGGLAVGTAALFTFHRDRYLEENACT